MATASVEYADADADRDSASDGDARSDCRFD